MIKLSLLILLTLISLSFRTYSQSYPIPAPDSQWGNVSMYGPPGLTGAGHYGSTLRYNGKDTVINEQTYQYWEGVYTRYNNNKMYMIDKYSSKPDSIVEVVLYDFNLAVNDTFLLPIFSQYGSYAIVNNVSDFTALNGQTRIEITLSIKGQICANNLKWIEGIGDVNNGVLYPYTIGICDISHRVVCFSDSSGNVYKEAGFDYPCDSLDNYVHLFDEITEPVTSDFGSKTFSKIELFPNPANEFVQVKIAGLMNYTAELYDTGGKLLLASSTINSTLRINLMSIKRGIYMMQFKSNNEVIGVRRVVKN